MCSAASTPAVPVPVVAQTNEVARFKGWKRMDYIEDYYAVTRRHVELEVLPYCTLNQVSMLVYHGLDYDFLTGKYNRNSPPLPVKVTRPDSRT